MVDELGDARSRIGRKRKRRAVKVIQAIVNAVESNKTETSEDQESDDDEEDSDSSDWHDPHSTLGYLFRVAAGSQGGQPDFEAQFAALSITCWLVTGAPFHIQHSFVCCTGPPYGYGSVHWSRQ